MKQITFNAYDKIFESKANLIHSNTFAGISMLLTKNVLIRKFISLLLPLLFFMNGFAQVNDGLVAYFPFNGNANDESINANNGTVNGATLTADRLGNGKNAYSFNGVDNFISIPHIAAYNSYSYSISLWYKFNGPGTAGKAYWSLISKNNNNSGFNSTYQLWINSSNNAGGRIGGGGLNVIDWYAPASIDFEWHHISYVFDNGKDSLIIYHDGAEAVRYPCIFNAYANTDPVTLGVWNGYFNYFNGAIDEVRIYNRPLSAEDAKNLAGLETCNGIDDDGDGFTDESCDIDSDGYSPEQGDCDDTNSNIHPNATELCNGFDDNCNGQIDEGFEKTTYYADSDGDTYGDAGVPMQVCSKPNGYVTDNTDCNDANASIHPGAPEICGNGIDDDCDGLIDEECITFDHDGDGYTFKDGDCNDADANIHPGATEICGNGIDDNCNGQLDEGCDLPGISIDDSRVVEGSMNVITTMTFTVSLSRPSADTIWVMARSADITTTAISDYKPDKGIIRFLPGVTTKKIKGFIYGDMIFEKNEKLKVILYNPVNAVITDSMGIGTIVDDDKRIVADKGADENALASNAIAIADGTIKVFPNPARDILNIQIGQPFKNNAAIQLVNLAGSVVKRFSLALSLKQSVHQLNIAGLSAGVYMLVVQDNSGNKTTQKIIINH